MTKNTILATAAAALSAVVLAMPLLAGSASASTTSKLLNCQSSSKQKVVDCCQRILSKNDRPQWMTQGSDSCSNAVKCIVGQRKCYVYIPNQIDTGRSSRDRTANIRGGKI